MIVLGLTGSIGMGKSTTAAMLEHLGVPVHDADAEVHTLLSEKGKARQAVAAAFPYFEHPEIYGRKLKNGVRAFKRKALGKLVFENENKRIQLENILHPYVRAAQNEFIRTQGVLGINMVAFDIPLLFETGAEKRVDFVINTTAPYFLQRTRVLARSNMDEKKFTAILKRQMPDGEKNVRADYALYTGLGRAYAMRELKKILRDINKKTKTAKPDDKQDSKIRVRDKQREQKAK